VHSERERINQWLSKAAELRAAAEQMKEKSARNALLSAAASYEALASNASARASPKRRGNGAERVNAG